MYTITLDNGTSIENLELNGNNFIYDGVIENSVFQDNLASVTISDGNVTKNYADMMLISNRIENGRSWFILEEKSEKQKQEEVTARRIETLENILNALLIGNEV